MTDERKLEIMNNILYIYRDCLASSEEITGDNSFDYNLGYFIRKQYGNEIYKDIQEKDKKIFKKVLNK